MNGGNRRLLQGNSPLDRRLLQSIKAKSTTLLIKVSGLRIFQGRQINPTGSTQAKVTNGPAMPRSLHANNSQLYYFLHK